MRAALELLDPADRQVIELRQTERRSYAEIGGELGISEDAARKRFDRALVRTRGFVDSMRTASTTLSR